MAKFKLLHFLPLIIWIFFIFIATSLPKEVIPPPPAFLDLFKPDKLIHLLMFAVYVLLFVKGALRSFGSQEMKVLVFVAVISGIAYGGLTELLQKYFFITRKASIYDFIANATGCFLGILLLKIRVKKEKSSSSSGSAP